ncbi:hypothetical protein B005_4491 [Nocardiopsis alba ATCC BAA-2165]|uniref:Uncharacterized protein n=1 Tax=Nocardiopsis alba (strain ATCC BAA-2165 / BE74) TaxID=1205910 RepID=J7LGH2_NOCAA|nr:hypothetical protein B005_4491 [Nocardiopsis alba ATCC BAA-2165]
MRTERGSVMLRMKAAPSARPSRAIGRIRPKSQRQSSMLRMSPDRVGPTAGATAMTMEMLPMVRPRRSAGIRFSTVVMSSGIMIAVPEACTIRPISRTVKFGARKQIRVPRLNRVIAVMNTCLRWNLWSRKPVTGMTTAITSMKAEVSHCPVETEMSRSRLRAGRATPMIVSFKMTTNAETRRSGMTSRVARASAPSSVVFGVLFLVTYFLVRSWVDEDRRIGGCAAAGPTRTRQESQLRRSEQYSEVGVGKKSGFSEGRRGSLAR